MPEIWECIKNKILDFVLYIPRKIARHFEDYNYYKREYLKQRAIINDYLKRFKSITYECERNDYGFSECNKRKIKEFAQVFGDTANSND